jgi:hypothetical protein
MPTLLQPNEEQLLESLKIFNQKVENINLEHTKLIPSNSNNESDGQKMLKLLASTANKWLQFLPAFEEFVDGTSKFYTKDEKLPENWKKLTVQSNIFIHELMVFVLYSLLLDLIQKINIQYIKLYEIR